MKSRGEALRDYVVRRLLLMIPTFIGVTFFTFLLTQFVPGGPIDQLRLQLAGGGGAGELGARGGRPQLEIPENQLQQLKAFYGFDKPFPVAYVEWLGKTVEGNFGNSFRYNQPVLKVIAQRLPISTYYGIITAIFTYAIAIPLGIVKAIRHRTTVDNLSSVLIFVGYAIPGFALGAVLVNILAVQLSIFPLGGFSSPGIASMPFLAQVGDGLGHPVLPLLAY